MPESFGARMRQQRERRQVALTAIAEQTKIKQSLLEAMERDDVAQWPSGIFRRAFIRSYAQAIGVDADATVREFLEFYPDPAEEIFQASTAPGEIAAAEGTPPPTRLRQLVGSAFSSLSRLRTASPDVAPVSSHPRAANVPIDTAAAIEAPPRRNNVPAVPVAVPGPSERDLLAVADLCTRFGRARRTDDLSPLFQELTRLLGAAGLMVWIWDPRLERLSARWAHGYSDAMLAQLPTVARDASNATAAAFRSGQTRSISGDARARGALVVPLISAHGCVGVLAIELHASETPGWASALATIFAAQLARILEERRLSPIGRSGESNRLPQRRPRSVDAGNAMRLATPMELAQLESVDGPSRAG